MKIDVTDSAAQRIKELIMKNRSTQEALRISVDGGGCSGFMYNYQLIDNINDDDYICEIKGIKVVIDETSQVFLNECVVEFVRELGGNYFQIINPKATAKCGCGNSFAI